MTTETEVRAIIADEEAMIKTLVTFGFERKPDVDQIDIIFDRDDASLFRSGQKIRIRVEGVSAEFTYKGKFMGDNVASRREEINIPIALSHIDGLSAILNRMGFPELYRIEKRRTSLTLGNTAVTLDRWPILGCLMEVEGAEKEILDLVREISPTVEFKNYRLRELFEQAAICAKSSIKDLQEKYEAANNVKLGRIDLLLQE